MGVEGLGGGGWKRLLVLAGVSMPSKFTSFNIDSTRSSNFFLSPGTIRDLNDSLVVTIFVYGRFMR